MTSPISSPQNLFAIERMSMYGTAPSWLAWFAVALPVALVGNLLCWLLLRLVYRDASFTEVRPLQAIQVQAPSSCLLWRLCRLRSEGCLPCLACLSWSCCWAGSSQ